MCVELVDGVEQKSLLAWYNWFEEYFDGRKCVEVELWMARVFPFLFLF